MNLIKSNFKKLDKVLLVLTLLLFICGLLNIVTASSREAVVRYQTSLYYYFFKQAGMIMFGLFLSFFIIMFQPKVYKFLVKVLFYIVLGLCIYQSFKGTEVNGATNWLTLPILNFAFQPSELAKLIIILYLSILFEENKTILENHTDKFYQKVALILFVGLAIPLLVFTQKDFGTMFIMIMIFFVLFINSPITRQDKFKIFTFLLVSGLLAVVALFITKGHIFTNAQLSRFDYFEPCQKYETIGYQVCNGYIAINNGGLTGLGIGKSKQIYSYIPEPHTDSVFAILAEELGVIKCSFIFLFYIIILYRILKISMNSKTLRGRYITLGVSTYIFMHIFLNLGGILGMIPLTGVPLPFLSYGGTYAIALMCSLAFVQKMNIENKKEKK